MIGALLTAFVIIAMFGGVFTLVLYGCWANRQAEAAYEELFARMDRGLNGSD